ncbi:MAG: mechanosensitive ion channel [Bdellovibrionales bacterium]|nr:mechanosensitive ion channel [Bdellovibrionales bacterium]
MNTNNFLAELQSLFTGYLPNILAALGILIVGSLVSYICMSYFRKFLRKINIENKIIKISKYSEKEKLPIVKWSGWALFSLLMIFVLIGFFQALGFSVAEGPLNYFLETILGYLPRLVAPLIIFFIAWVVANGLKIIIINFSEKTKIDEKFSSLEYMSDKDKTPSKAYNISHTFAEIVYWLVFLLFLPAVLDSLAIEGLLGPVNTMVNKFLSFLPNLFAASLIIIAGWVVAKIIQKIVFNFVKSLGANSISEKVGLAKLTGSHSFSEIIGSVVYILVLLPVAIAGLNALKVEAITQPASEMLSTFLGIIPTLFGAALILLLSFIVARLICSVLTDFLKGIGFDDLLIKLGISSELQSDKYSLSQLGGYVAMLIIMLFATIEAFNVIGLTQLSDIITRFTVFLGHVGLGLVILAIGLYLANFVAKLIKHSTTPHAGILSLISRVSIIALAASMALEQIVIANEVVITAFGVILAGASLAFGLAFGLGGREEAAKILSDIKNKFK